MKEIFVMNNIKLIPMTTELYHKEMTNYISDPMMCETPYVYKKEVAQRVYEKKTNDKNRKWFAIILNTDVIGEVYFKKIDFEKKTGVLSIAFTQDCYKDKNYFPFSSLYMALIIKCGSNFRKHRNCISKCKSHSYCYKRFLTRYLSCHKKDKHQSEANSLCQTK